MKKILFVCLGFLFSASLAAQMPERNAENLKKYKEICRQHIYKNMKGMYRQPVGALKYPFLVPGSGQYANQLWDWDSWLSDIALRQIIVEHGTDADRKELITYEKGCILNFLNYGGGDGWIPICIFDNTEERWQLLQKINPWKTNMHKPVLAQHAAFVVKQTGGDAEWLREGFYNLQTFVGKYLNYHRHKATGLLYWENDEMIGVDNDPSTFYRPQESSGSIFLNALMYRELLAMAYLATQLRMPDLEKRFTREAEELQEAIRKHCWDPRDGFYYSVDLNLLPVEKPATPGFHYHTGQPRTYDCLIQRFSVWSGFMALWAGIATSDQAREIVERQYRDPRLFNAAAGVRSLLHWRRCMMCVPAAIPLLGRDRCGYASTTSFSVDCSATAIRRMPGNWQRRPCCCWGATMSALVRCTNTTCPTMASLSSTRVSRIGTCWC